MNVRLDGRWVTILVDTGAAVSIIPRQLYETALSHTPLLPTTVNLRAYGGSRLVVMGVVTTAVETEDGRSCQGRLYVVDAVRRCSGETCRRVCASPPGTAPGCTKSISNLDDPVTWWSAAIRTAPHRGEVSE